MYVSDNEKGIPMNKADMETSNGEYDHYNARVFAECPYCEAENDAPEYDENCYNDGTTDYVWYENVLVCVGCGDPFIINAGRYDC